MTPPPPPKKPGPTRAATEALFAGGGEMGERMRAFDWAKSRLGPVEHWPQSLKTSVSTCLNSRFAVLVWWGKDLVKLYNDAYAPILGKKHPGALGSPGRQVWPEIWHIIGPMLESVMEDGEATWSDNLLLELERDGYPEECYFTFSYSPILDESGGVGGVFTPVQETTAQVIGERRLRTLRDLAEAARVTKAGNVEGACRAEGDVLARNPYDVPFAAIYLFGDEPGSARLAASPGIPPHHPLFPPAVNVADHNEFLTEALQSVSPQVISLAAVSDRIPAGAWPAPPQEAMVFPIAPAAQRLGFLILGVSPRKRLDRDYRDFLSLVSGQIATAAADARAYEEEQRRVEMLAQLDRAKTVFFSNISHEFRTPLTLVLGPVEDALADCKGLTPASREALELAHRNALRLQKMVNSLLDFSRIEAGRVSAARRATDLSSLTEDLASNFRSIVERRARVRGELRAALEAGLCGPGDVGEDRLQSSFECVQIHVRRTNYGAFARGSECSRA